MKTNVAVLIVSDFELIAQKTWQDEIETLKAFVAQDFDQAFELILVENSRFASSVPEAIHQVAPHARILFTDETQSAKQKDYAVRHTDAELIAVVDADCTPNKVWLRTLVSALQEHPDVDVVSGRTWYGDQSVYHRCLNLLHRAFDDYGKSSPSEHISNNGALYRRRVLEAYPYPEAITPFFSSRLRNRRIREGGHCFYFHRDALLRHAIGSMEFMFDVHRNMGYSDMMQDHSGPFYTSIPRVMLQRTKYEIASLRRVGREYLKPSDWVLLPLFMLMGRCFEVAGMLDAIANRDSIPKSAFR